MWWGVLVFFFINRIFNSQLEQVHLFLAHLFGLLKSHHLSNEALSMVTIGINKPVIQDKIVLKSAGTAAPQH